MRENIIKALLIKVGEAPKQIEIANELKAYQHAVGGYIEFYPLEGGKATIIMDEEGKLKGYAGKRRVGNEIIAGDFLIVGDNGKGEFISLTSKQVSRYTERFKVPEVYAPSQIEENIMIEVMSPIEFERFVDPRPIPFPKRNNEPTR